MLVGELIFPPFSSIRNSILPTISYVKEDHFSSIQIHPALFPSLTVTVLEPIQDQRADQPPDWMRLVMADESHLSESRRGRSNTGKHWVGGKVKKRRPREKVIAYLGKKIGLASWIAEGQVAMRQVLWILGWPWKQHRFQHREMGENAYATSYQNAKITSLA